MRYLIEGRIVPERIRLSFSKFGIGIETPAGHKIIFSLEIIESRIFVHVAAPKEVAADIKNLALTNVGNAVNYAGFKMIEDARIEQQ